MKNGVNAFGFLFNKMATYYENGAGTIVGTPFQDLVLESALRRRSVFIEKSGKTKMEHIGASVQEDYSAFLLKAQEAFAIDPEKLMRDRKSTRLNSSHLKLSRMPSSA